MMITCPSCGIDTDDSTGYCQLCDASLGSQAQQVSTPAVRPAAPQISSNSISSALLNSNYFAPIDPNTDEIDRNLMFELPVSLTKATVGRTDINVGIIPTISVEKRWPKGWISVAVQNGGMKDLFSRKTGSFRRDPISGKLFFQVDPLCSVTVLIATPNSDEFKPFLKGDEKLINSGTKLAFGQGGDVLKTIVL